MCKKIISIILLLCFILSLSIPAFAAESPSEQNPSCNIFVEEDMGTNSNVEPRFSWVYSEDAPYGITFESTPSRVTEGNTKLSQAIETCTIGLLAGSIASILPISTAAQVVAGAILGSIPTAFFGSTTLYYRVYVYPATGAWSSWYNKCVVYFYYDEAMTAFAESAIYYGSKC